MFDILLVLTTFKTMTRSSQHSQLPSEEDEHEIIHVEEAGGMSYLKYSSYRDCKNSFHPYRLFCIIAFIFAFFLTLFSYKYDGSSLNAISSNRFDSFQLQYIDLPAKVTKVAFGSCNSQHFPGFSHWENLMYGPFQPDLLLFMGDNVYGDCNDDECSILQQAYNDLARHISYQEIVRRIPILATLDDHDYGHSDATRHNPYKDQAVALFNEFFNGNHDQNFKSNTKRRGVYSSKEFLIDDKDKDAILQVIFLDTRYFKDYFLESDDPGTAGKEVYMEDFNKTDNTMLGDEQWDWLEEQLRKPAVLRIVVSSIQAIANGHGFECWRHFPYEREKLYSLLGKPAGGGRAVIVSGDHHVGGIYRVELSDGNELVEVTGSSWTHSIPFGAYGSNCTTAEDCDEVDDVRLFDLVRFNNFGSIEIDWKNRTALLAVRKARSTDGCCYSGEKFSDAGEIIQSLSIDI